jgi:hypothetical protein
MGGVPKTGIQTQSDKNHMNIILKKGANAFEYKFLVICHLVAMYMKIIIFLLLIA